MSILRFTSEGGRPTAKEHSPRPRSPTWAWPSSRSCRSPQPRVRLPPRLGHRAPGHLPVFAVELVPVVGPTSHDVADGLLPHLTALGGIDPEALELGPGGRSSGAEVDPPFRQQVEHGHRLRRAHRVVVGLGHQAHAVTEADPIRPSRNRPVEDLGVRAVRVLLQEVCSTVQNVCQPWRSPAMACSSVFWYATSCVLLPRTWDGNLVEERGNFMAWAPPGRLPGDDPG